MATVQGTVEPGFEPVREAFQANFDSHGEVGAGAAVYYRGRPVVDLWGGVADEGTGRAWEKDTPVVVFSTTKGATAVCANILADLGELDVDAPVTKYWPEFGREGKQDMPVSYLLSHQAGLAAIDATLTLDEVLAWTPIVEALAAQRPIWEPGTAHGYHALTFGWLVGEVVRRISGRSIGKFFADEVAGPLGLEFWIGLPDEMQSKAATLITMDVPASLEDLPAAAEGGAAETPPGMDLMLMLRALSLNGAFPGDAFNMQKVRAAEIPAAAGVATARAIARMYAGLLGDVDGVRLVSPDALEKLRTPLTKGGDKVLGIETRFGRGFMLHAPFTPIGSERSFGHPGAGGSIGWADPEAQLTVGYVMNKMQMNLSGDPRMLGLVEAAYESVKQSA